jgi:CRP/FNR family nitrogen fixation transcriptional regulator
MQTQSLSYAQRGHDAAHAIRASAGAPALIGVTKRFERDQPIFSEGDGAEHVFRVVSGAVRVFCLLSDGRRQIEEFYLPGDVFGVELSGRRHATAEAVGDAVLVVARRAHLAADPVQAERLWDYALCELARCRGHVMTLGQRTASERVAAFLMELAERLDTLDGVDLPMTRQDMADYLGLTIETVSRSLTQLQKDRLIELQGCRHIRFTRPAALAELCE